MGERVLVNKAEEYVYFTTALKKFKITRNQLWCAIKGNLVRAREVRNPHYPSRKAYIVSVTDIQSHLKKIKGFPKYSEEERERRKLYAKRSHLRKKLGFYCPRCKKFIRVRRDSALFEKFLNGEIDEEDFRRIIIISHYRHEHTPYDKDRKNVEKWLNEEERKEWWGLLDEYRFVKKNGLDRELILDDIQYYKDLARERAKKQYNELALKLAMEDGLIKDKT